MVITPYKYVSVGVQNLALAYRLEYAIKPSVHHFDTFVVCLQLLEQISYVSTGFRYTALAIVESCCSSPQQQHVITQQKHSNNVVTAKHNDVTQRFCEQKHAYGSSNGA